VLRGGPMKRTGSALLSGVLLLPAALAFAQTPPVPPSGAPAFTADELMLLDPIFKEAYDNCTFVATVGKDKAGAAKTEECHDFLKGHGKPNGMALPEQAPPHMETLRKEIAEVWPEMKWPSVFAAQIEQESCISLKHKKCWNSKSELSTDREYGFGLGQLTLKYKDGSGTACKEDGDCKVKGELCRPKDGKCAIEEMNMFKEMQKLDQQISGALNAKLTLWDWSDRGNAAYQIRSVVLLNKQNWNAMKFVAANDVEKLAMMLSAYNGGLGHVLKDRKLCEVKKDCDPTRWFGNIEKDSVKKKTALPGYGKSFFEINREYPVHILFTRRPKYAALTDGPLPTPVPTVAPPAVVTLPAVTKQGALKFPPAAALAGKKEAEVVVQLTINEDGSIGKVQKVKGEDLFLDAAKESLKKNWEFSAGTRDGVPVESSFELTLLFKK
jgi:hypothetical protein